MLKGAKYGKAVIHKRAKRQSIHLVANRLQFKFGRSQLKRSKSVCSDNNHIPSLETLHFAEIFAQSLLEKKSVCSVHLLLPYYVIKLSMCNANERTVTLSQDVALSSWQLFIVRRRIHCTRQTMADQLRRHVVCYAALHSVNSLLS